MSDADKLEKLLKIGELLAYSFGVPEMKYFNVESEELLDEKIEVLTQIKDGKAIKDIPNFYKVLEGMPTEGIWD